MNREQQDAQLHIPSAYLGREETPIIRSHRRSTGRSTIVRRVTACAIVIAVSAGGVTTATANEVATPQTQMVALPAVAPIVQEVRAQAAVSRSLARKISRTARINRVINYALAQQGDRYRWGASGPNRWDCSGLVMKSFKQIGIKLPHYTGGMLKKGKKVSKRNLKRGDIIFPQRGHAAIYLGNGKMVAASSGKGRVIVQKVYGFYAARRLL